MKPKILLLDIETSPATAYIWNMYDTFTPLERLIEPGRVLCVSWKFLDESELHFRSEWTHSRSQMLVDVRNAMNLADAVVTYNGDKFDLPKLNGELVTAFAEPMGPVTSIDLYKVVKKLGYISGKLEFIAPFLEVGRKAKTAGFSLWRDVLAGDAEAREKMERYNKQDVRLLGGLYKRLKPYMTNHPAIRDRADACLNCGSKHLQKRGHRFTKTYKIEKIQCMGCGAWPPIGKRTKVQ